MTLDKYTNFEKKDVRAVFEKIQKKTKLRKGCKLGLSWWLQINENMKVVWWPHHMFFIKIVSAVFEIFRIKEGKKHFFSCTITILDHILYGKVKTNKKQKTNKKIALE